MISGNIHQSKLIDNFDTFSNNATHNYIMVNLGEY